MNAVGIDISKGKSTVAIMRPFGEIVDKPFEVNHTVVELTKLAEYLKSLTGETRIIMEYTGKYYQPIARHLYEAGLNVTVVHPMLIYSYGNNSIRRVKTDKKDAIKIANYGLDHWTKLVQYVPEENLRLMLKTYNRQYGQYIKMKTALKNNLISLLDQTFPDVNSLFSSPVRVDGHEKWIDFVSQFWHCEYVSGMSVSKFTEQYGRWCKKHGYHSNAGSADKIYTLACANIGILPQSESTKLLIKQTVAQLNSVSETAITILHEMQRLSSLLPEYPVVMAMSGVGNVLGPRLIAEIGDVRRFERKQSLIAFAGIDAPPFQSGTYESQNRNISKRGSPALRHALFQVMAVLLQNAPSNDPVFQFLDKKRAEGKNYYVYMMAGANKFLCIYYARAKEYLNEQDTAA